MRRRGAGVLIGTLAFVFAFIVFGVPVAPVSPCGDVDTYRITMADSHQTYINIIYKSKYPPDYCQTGTEEPPTPLIIHGFVFYENKTECNNPIVNITNLNTSRKWMAKTHNDSNYYLLMLVHGRDANVSEILQFNVESPDGSQLNTTTHKITWEDANKGGIFFNISLKPIHDVYIDTGYTGTYGTGIRIDNATVEKIPLDCNLTIGETYHIKFKVVNNGTVKPEQANITVEISNGTWRKVLDAYEWDINNYHIGDVTWDTSGLAPGNYIITVNASIPEDAHPEDNKRTREVMLELPLYPPPNITSWYPEETVIEDIEGAKRTFNISINQTVNVIWRINGTEVFNQSGVNFSEYTNESAVAGYWEVTAYVFNENGSDTHTWLWSVKDITPPASVSDLHNITYEQNFINWTWIDPPDADFSYVIVYIDGKFAGNVTKGVQYYNATSLEPNTEHTIATRTVDIWGNINETWVNHTARTAPDTTPPEIVNYEPKGANVPITANITATFSEEINPSTLNNETIIVENSSKHRVKGNIFYDSEHFKVIFDPLCLEYNETYTVTITTGVQDVAGNNMTSNFSWNFTTEKPPSTVVIIEDVYAVPNESVTVPIIVRNVENLGSGTINVTYNSSVVHVINMETGEGNALEVQSWNADNTTGIVRIVALSANESKSGDVIFANVTLKAVGHALEFSYLNISVYDLTEYYNYTKIQCTVRNGTFFIKDIEPPVLTNASASPAIILSDTGRPRPPGTNITRLNVTVTDASGIANVTINLSSIGGASNATMHRINGTNIWTITTNASAGANITHALTVTACDIFGNCNTTIINLTVLLRGDVVRDGQITSGDALYIAKFLVGKEETIDMLVADIIPAEGDGRITSGDALYIAKYLAGKEKMMP
ncbi:MAG: Ig-like domain-containing protein [Candidatus Methanospirare jalkutatii]|nr:Ig-like domain-containing protein [Candidatus Methanospirare jalkutatii]